MRNRTITTICIGTALVIFSALPAQCQSTFGIYYLGEHVIGGGSRDRALAYSTLAVPDSSGALVQNPAALADVTRVTLSLMQLFEVSRARTADETADLANYSLPHVMVAAPLKKGIVFSLGYKTGFIGRADFAYPRIADDIPLYYEIYRHRGSLFTIPIGLSIRVREWLKLSASYELERGSIKNDVRIEFYDRVYAATESARDRSFSGESWSAALMLRIHPRIYIGGLWDHEVEYEVNEILSYSRSAFDSSSTWNMRLPSAFGVGAAVGVTGRWWLSSQYWMREAPGTEGFPQLSGAVGDETMIGVGLERRPVPESGFFGRIPIRLGYYQNSWHLEAPRDETVVSRFFTIGTSFGLPGGPGSIDLSIELGQIGSVDSNGSDERMVRFGLGFSVSETWSGRDVDSWH
jgi:hypothetical protein